MSTSHISLCTCHQRPPQKAQCNIAKETMYRQYMCHLSPAPVPARNGVVGIRGTMGVRLRAAMDDRHTRVRTLSTVQANHLRLIGSVITRPPTPVHALNRDKRHSLRGASFIPCGNHPNATPRVFLSTRFAGDCRHTVTKSPMRFDLVKIILLTRADDSSRNMENNLPGINTVTLFLRTRAARVSFSHKSLTAQKAPQVESQ